MAYFMFQEQLETSRREMIGLQERDRQLQCKNRNLHQLLKNEKDEVSFLLPCMRWTVGFWNLRCDIMATSLLKKNCLFILCHTVMVGGHSCAWSAPAPGTSAHSWQQQAVPLYHPSHTHPLFLKHKRAQSVRPLSPPYRDRCTAPRHTPLHQHLTSAKSPSTMRASLWLSLDQGPTQARRVLYH